MAALGLAGEFDVAADAVDVDFLRVAVEAQLAADAVDVERAPGDAGERDVGADDLDLHLGVARHLEIERGVAHARLGAPVEPALLVRRLDLDREAAAAALDIELLRAFA